MSHSVYVVMERDHLPFHVMQTDEIFQYWMCRQILQMQLHDWYIMTLFFSVRFGNSDPISWDHDHLLDSAGFCGGLRSEGDHFKSPEHYVVN